MKRKWWLLAAGVAFSCARWWKHVEAASHQGNDNAIVVDHRAARAAGDFEVELTRARRAPRAKRLASTLLFVTLFCAGATFTAGAGNELVTTDETTAVAEAAAPSPEPAVEAAAAPAAPAEPAPAPVEDAAPAPEPAPAAESGPAPAPVDDAPAAPETPPAAESAAPSDDVTPATAPARPDYVEPADDGNVEPAAAPAAKKTATRSTRAPRRAANHVATAAPVPQVVIAATPSFVPTVPFDLTSWEHDNPGSTTGTAAVAIAQHFVGTPYVWGGASPSGGFDCSGLMLYVYSQLGVSLPHYAASQFMLFSKLKPAELQPGDLVFFEPKIDGPGHVAMYAGGDAIIEAPHTGALVRIGSLSRSAAALGFMGAVRPYSAEPTAARAIARHHRATRAEATGVGTARSVFAA